MTNRGTGQGGRRGRPGGSFGRPSGWKGQAEPGLSMRAKGGAAEGLSAEPARTKGGAQQGSASRWLVWPKGKVPRTWPKI
ncbi:hypothetical protein Nepgr_000882 [Nepenthes gracilis]|uniref:Uncharacterized protein n=1 Tax=Nepenthes gracilis TaxID=150966 RepID=A0AAD3RX75_NEPGR|nr:hypothetical protein Nepgr_000882 [Nepenthes gracilis]